MAKQFLAQILTLENSVQPRPGQDCVICQEQCGTLSPETGIMELEVRLPCKHTVGSACIANWLADNNTCPLCRHEFFPRQPRPYMEHEVMQGHGDEAPNRGPLVQGESLEDFITRLSNNSESHDSPLAFAVRNSRPLHLDLPVTFLALNIADTADNLDSLRGRPAEAIAAAALYIASHILNQPRALSEVARATAISESAIENVYREIYADRYELVDEDWRQIVGGATLGEAAETLPSLTWPPLMHSGIHISEISTGFGTPSALTLVKDLCFHFHAEDTNLDMDAIDNYRVAQKIADIMHNMSYNWRTVNPFTIAAACTYMASYIVFRSKSIAQCPRADRGVGEGVLEDLLLA